MQLGQIPLAFKAQQSDSANSSPVKLSSPASATTGFTAFAECRLHSAKASLHSANSLPSVTLGKRHSAKPPTVKGSLSSVGFRAHGKDFAESLGPRHRSHVARPWAGSLPSA